MPRKDTVKFPVETPDAIEADTLLLVSIQPVAHYFKADEDQIDGEGNPLTASGNIQPGDTLAVDTSGDFVKSELFAVSFIALDGVTVTKVDTVQLTGEQMLALTGNHPNARNEIKATGYDALEIIGIAPPTSVVT